MFENGNRPKQSRFLSIYYVPKVTIHFSSPADLFFDDFIFLLSTLDFKNSSPIFTFSGLAMEY